MVHHFFKFAKFSLSSFGPRPPPRAVESSIDKFTAASFQVITTYDRVDEKLGRQQITEGVLVLVPNM